MLLPFFRYRFVPQSLNPLGNAWKSFVDKCINKLQNGESDEDDTNLSFELGSLVIYKAEGMKYG